MPGEKRFSDLSRVLCSLSKVPMGSLRVEWLCAVSEWTGQSEESLREQVTQLQARWRSNEVEGLTISDWVRSEEEDAECSRYLAGCTAHMQAQRVLHFYMRCLHIINTMASGILSKRDFANPFSHLLSTVVVTRPKTDILRYLGALALGRSYQASLRSLKHLESEGIDLRGTTVETLLTESRVVMCVISSSPFLSGFGS